MFSVQSTWSRRPLHLKVLQNMVYDHARIHVKTTNSFMRPGMRFNCVRSVLRAVEDYSLKKKNAKCKRLKILGKE